MNPRELPALNTFRKHGCGPVLKKKRIWAHISAKGNMTHFPFFFPFYFRQSHTQSMNTPILNVFSQRDVRQGWGPPLTSRHSARLSSLRVLCFWPHPADAVFPALSLSCSHHTPSLHPPALPITLCPVTASSALSGRPSQAPACLGS